MQVKKKEVPTCVRVWYIFSVGACGGDVCTVCLYVYIIFICINIYTIHVDISLSSLALRVCISDSRAYMELEKAFKLSQYYINLVFLVQI